MDSTSHFVKTGRYLRHYLSYYHQIIAQDSRLTSVHYMQNSLFKFELHVLK